MIEPSFAPAHRLLGPRPVYWVSTYNADSSVTTCPATNVSSVGVEPPYVAVALSPEWRTSARVFDTKRFTISAISDTLLDETWILGSSYSKIRIPTASSKLHAAGLREDNDSKLQSPVIEGVWTALDCEVVEILQRPYLDHIVFLACVKASYADPSFVSNNGTFDLQTRGTLLQVVSSRFATANALRDADQSSIQAKADQNSWR